jgi:predicted TIM-barrel fold metal-dependent hydrolase
MRYIDSFCHFFPPKFFEKIGTRDMGKRMRGIPAIYDLDVRLKVIDQFPGYSQIICLGVPVEFCAGPKDSPELARIGNDGLAEIVAKNPDRFAGYAASLPLNAPDAIGPEAERALKQGANGIQIYTNVDGVPLDDPRFEPIFEIAAKYHRPLLLHPTRGPGTPDYSTETRSKYEVWAILGWPYETSVAMARLVFSGIMKRYPGLKVLTHHLGAMIPYFESRVAEGWDLIGTRTTEDESHVLKMLGRRPVDCFRDFYGDTALCGSRAGIVCGIDFFGADHVLFGTDSPFDPEFGPGWIRKTIAVLESIDMPTLEREKICHRNAEKLFGLKL